MSTKKFKSIASSGQKKKSAASTSTSLTRRPIRHPLGPKYRPAALPIRRYSKDAEYDSDEFDYEDDSADYRPPPLLDTSMSSTATEDDDEDEDEDDVVVMDIASGKIIVEKRQPVRRSTRLAKTSKSTSSKSTTPKKKSPQKQKRRRVIIDESDSEDEDELAKKTPAKVQKFMSPKPIGKSTPLIKSQVRSMILVDGDNRWGERVPLEVLCKIFGHLVDQEKSAVRVLTNMQLVCHLWRDAASVPKVWSKVDLEYLKHHQAQDVFNGLAKYAPGIRELSVSRWVNLPTRILENFLHSTKDLRSLNVSFCRMLDLRRIMNVVVPAYCPHLTALDVSFIDPMGSKIRVTSVLRDYLMLPIGRNLEVIRLAGNALSDLRQLIAEAVTHKATENIRVLDLSRVCSDRRNSRKIRLVDFVRAFPNLRELDMSEAMLDFTCTEDEETYELADAWPKLYECKISTDLNCVGYQKLYDVFMGLLSRCSNLRRLDVSGLHLYDRLALLRDTPLSSLTMNHIQCLAKDAISIEFFKTWNESLEELSIAWIRIGGFVEDLCKLFETAKMNGYSPRLKRLKLTGTSLTAEQLGTLLTVCKSLEYVDVQSCRGLPVGMKRAYVDIEEVKGLRAGLAKIDAM